MKEGTVVDACGVPNEQELAMINRLARRKLSADEVFVFSLVLCDNEIDRDLERFSIQALRKMADLFVGKTGIFDHSMKGRDQVARIFSCAVEEPGGQTTQSGEPYMQLKARAYMPVTPNNKQLITEIDAGIKKEVSIGCAVARIACSVCGADLKKDRCEHQKGKVYHTGGKDVICCHVLDRPTDAYEWSFVAVPAQPKAGVTKAFSQQKKGGIPMQTAEIVKSLSAGQAVNLSAGEAAALSKWIGALEAEAKAGRRHRESVEKEVLRLGALAQPEWDAELMVKMIAGLDYTDLCAMKQTFVKQLDSVFPPHSQFESAKSEPDRNPRQNETFVI